MRPASTLLQIDGFLIIAEATTHMLNLAGIIFENFLLLVLDIKNTLRAVLVNSFGFNRLETSRCEGLGSMPVVLAILYDKSVSELALQL